MMPFVIIIIAEIYRNFSTSINISGKISCFIICICAISFLCGQKIVYNEQIQARIEDNHYDHINTALNVKIGSATLLWYLRGKTNYNSPIISNSPHLVQNIMETPVVGLAEFSYINHHWPLVEVNKTICKFNVGYILFFPKIFHSYNSIDKNNIFFKELSINKKPSWLEEIYSDNNVFVFKVSNLTEN
jgi:hypothetical protein